MARGLWNKFQVKRSDGTDRRGEKHYRCDYFVLDLTHDPVARQAAAQYCIATANVDLARDLAIIIQHHVSENETLPDAAFHR